MSTKNSVIHVFPRVKNFLITIGDADPNSVTGIIYTIIISVLFSSFLYFVYMSRVYG